MIVRRKKKKIESESLRETQRGDRHEGCERVNLD